MILRTVRKLSLVESAEKRRDLEFWLGRAPDERLAAVDRLRNEWHGDGARQLLALFNAHQVEYVVVGGYALAFHGAPRFTGDLDLLVRATDGNAAKIVAALVAFGFGSLGLTAGDFLAPDRVVQLGVPPARIDLLTSISGVTWEDVSSGRVRGAYGEVPVDFIGRREFVKNKRASGRHRDLADLEALGEA